MELFFPKTAARVKITTTLCRQFSGECFHTHRLGHTVPADSGGVVTPFLGGHAATHRSQALISYVPVTNLGGKEGHKEIHM